MKHYFRKQTRLLTALILVGVIMFAAAFAFVPLYQLFCQATGWGGTTSSDTIAAAEKTDQAAKTDINEPAYDVRLDANVNPDLPWSFTANEPILKNARTGEIQEVMYHVKNKSNQAITGIALHNIAPSQAGVYFKRIKCFCDVNKTLQPGEEMDLPVVFRIDPKIKDDPDLKGVKTITWSYTYFRAKEGAKDGEKDKSFKEKIK